MFTPAQQKELNEVQANIKAAIDDLQKQIDELTGAKQMSTTPATVNLTPTWTAVARMHIMLIDHGTEEGKQDARDGILEMGKLIDQLVAEREQES